MSTVTPGAGPGRELRIDLDAIAHNVGVLRDRFAPARLMVVVKAQAYGHGAIATARTAIEAGADWLGTADLDEALALRSAGITAPVLAWLHGPATPFEAAAEAGIDVGVSSLEQLERAAAAGAVVQLKVDTGLSRNGVPPEELPAVLERAARLQAAGLRIRGVFSHLANASPADTAAQDARFRAALDAARAAGVGFELAHLAASEAALTRPETRYDLVRAGIAVYGLAPDRSVDPAAVGLRPAMECAAEVVAVRRIPAGEGVSYGFDYRASRSTSLALVPLGYADGVPRAASNRAEVLIRGVRHRIAGRIAMDQFVVDVGDTPVRVGDRAVLWGDPATGAPSADEWAEAAGTIGYEIVTRAGGRAERRYTGGRGA